MRFDPDRISARDMLRTIRDLDYEPEIVEAPSEVVELAPRVDVASLPKSFADFLERARDLGRPVLVEFSGPG